MGCNLELVIANGVRIHTPLRKVVETKLSSYETIQHNQKSNRLYHAFFLVKTDQLHTSGIYDFDHQDLEMNQIRLEVPNESYFLVKIQSHNKIAIDFSYDHIMRLNDSMLVTFIKKDIRLVINTTNQYLDTLGYFFIR